MDSTNTPSTTVLKIPGKAFVIHPDGKVRAVKNLGWLLKRWKDVIYFVLAPVGGTMAGRMQAFMRDGRTYDTTWASYDLMLQWLGRPVFQGAEARFPLTGARKTIARGQWWK
jgi:hypothetical protein